jgi:hypothetical protein
MVATEERKIEQRKKAVAKEEAEHRKKEDEKPGPEDKKDSK